MSGRARGLALAAPIVAAALSACGGTRAAPAQAPPARLERLGSGPQMSVVLSALGERRIGIETVRVAAVRHATTPTPGPTAVFPYSALVYEPDGTPVVYVNPSPGVFTREPVTIDHIAGDGVYATRGPPPGTRIVTVGAEELLGAENGVGVGN